MGALSVGVIMEDEWFIIYTLAKSRKYHVQMSNHKYMHGSSLRSETLREHRYQLSAHCKQPQICCNIDGVIGALRARGLTGGGKYAWNTSSQAYF
jgi:hypothetical protein